MKISAHSNMYVQASSAVREAFEPLVSGAPDGLVAIVCHLPLSEQARQALENSAISLGYGANACTFIQTSLPMPADQTEAFEPEQDSAHTKAHAASSPEILSASTDKSHSTSEEAASLGSEELRLLLEAGDPLVLISTDSHAAELLSNAYGCPLLPDGVSRMMGRSVVAFADFNAMMGDPKEKQRAWALLKALKR